MGQISPILENILSIIPAAILVFVLAVYLMGIYWREDTKRKLKQYLKNIRSHDISIQKYNGLLGKFNEFEDKPPFSTQFDSILRKLAELHGNRDREMKLYSRLRGETDQHSKKGLKNRLLGPWYWLETHRKLNTLQHLDSVVTTNVDEVGIDVHQLMHIQNEISRQITEVWQENQELEHNIQILIRRGVRADLIAPYKHVHQRLHGQFKSIPATLLTPAQHPATNSDTLKHIADAYMILEESRPALEGPLVNSRVWLEQTELLPQAIQQVQGKTTELEDWVRKVPDNIDTTSFQSVLQEARLAAEHGIEFSRHIDPFQLESILEALTRQYEQLNHEVSVIKTAEQVLADYQHLRKSLNQAWHSIETLLPQLTENPVLPIVLNETSEELEFMRASIHRLLRMNQPHPIQKYQEEIPLLQEKIEKAKALINDLTTMQATQVDLMALVKRLQYPKVKGWLEKTEAARNRLKDYAVGNYSQLPNWQALDLDVELQKIQSLSQNDLPTFQQPIREDQLLGKWQTAQNLDKLVNLIQDGLNNQLQQRKALIKNEQAIQEAHENIVAQLNSIADAHFSRDKNRRIQSFFRRLDQFKENLLNRKQGTLSEKGKQLETLRTEICAQLDEWLVESQEQLKEQHDTLSALLQELNKTMNLRDEWVADLREYLAQDVFFQQPQQQELSDIIECYLLNEEHQEQSQDFLEKLQPMHAELMQHFNAFQQIQKTFHDGFASAAEFVDFSSSWNQNVLSLERFLKQAKELDQEMEHFLSQEHHSQNMIRKLTQYTNRYEEYVERMTELLAKVQQEKAQQREAENALQAAMDQWRQVARTWQEDRIVAENVENLLERYQTRFEDAKMNFERGRIRFTSFIATINSLRKHLLFEAITNENDKSVEISGKEYI